MMSWLRSSNPMGRARNSDLSASINRFVNYPTESEPDSAPYLTTIHVCIQTEVVPTIQQATTRARDLVTPTLRSRAFAKQLISHSRTLICVQIFDEL